jgi:type IV pilus assembly protein PilB
MATFTLSKLFSSKESTGALTPFYEFLSQQVSEEEMKGATSQPPFALEAKFVARVGRARWLVALGRHYNVQAFNLEEADVSPLVALIVPKDLGELNRVAAIALDEFGVTLAMVDPNDERAVKEVEARTDFVVKERRAVLLQDLTAFQTILYGSARNLDVSPRDVVDQILKEALERRASDVHIEPLEDEILVRFRQDGMLVHGTSIRNFAPKRVMMHHLKSALSVVVKNKSGSSGKTMDIAECQRPQDGRIYMPGRNIDMRVSVLPTVHGESIVIRIHTPDSEREGLSELGFSPEVLERFEPVIANPYGIFLVSGPTGSGKTTTLYTVLKRLNCPEKKVLTIEDPVEYQIPGVMQIQTNAAKGVNFASALRSFLRHDPDIIMVGEIRDSETAVTAVEASLTGHLVLSTVHANDAVRTITRLRDLGVQPMLIASTCLGTMAQRLLRINCPHCSVPTDFSDRFRLLCEHYGIEPGETRQGKGCTACNHTGFLGRTAIHELLVITPEIRDLILASAPDTELIAMARKQGMRLLVEDALHKACQGLTTEHEVFRVTLHETH